MFNVFLKRRGSTINILKHHVVKRRINSNALPKSLLWRNGIVKNLEQQFWIKHTRIIGVNNRKYSSLPASVEVEKPHVFVSHEDDFAHSILESREIYSTTIVNSFPVFDDEITINEVENYVHKSWKNLPIPEMIHAFKRISHYALTNNENILDEKYERFIKYLITNCQYFTDSEISEVLLSMALWPKTYTRQDENFKSLYQALDRDCIRRAGSWSVNELLLFSDHWYKLKLYRNTEFAAYVIKKLGSKPNRMTPNNLVQFMFYVNSSRTHPRDMYNLEYRMESCIDSLDINELAIIAMGFFKSQTPIRNSTVLVKIIQRVIKEIDTIHEISLSAFMKIIRYSTMIQIEYGIIWELLVSTLSQIPRLSLQALVHIVTTIFKVRIFHPEILTSVAERFNQEIKNARLKDMERLVMALTCFNFTPDIQPNIYETIVQELSIEGRRPELQRYPKPLASLLRYLSVPNVYPKDLIAFVMDPVNIKNVYGATPYSLDDVLLVVDLNVEAEVPDYTGPRLNSRSRSIIAKGYVNSPPDSINRTLSTRHALLFEVLETCKELFGSTEMMHLDWVLPHFKEVDIIICLDKNNMPLPVKPLLSVIPFGDLKRRPKIYLDGFRWLAVVMGSKNSYIRDSMQLLGKDFTKIRQLERIGYEPIVIPWWEWHMNDQDRKKYLQKKLFK